MVMNNKTQSAIFSSRGNGKLLLSGEYVVLKGAKALSIPLKLGQTLDVYEDSETFFSWKATHPKGQWNKVKFNDKLTITSSTDDNFAKLLQKILRSSIKLSSLKLKDLIGKKAITHLEFMPEWGLGSSSTLIYNLATFFKINPYELLKATFKGSGYDIASAGIHKPIFFLLVNKEPRSVEISFNPPFKENIYFIYSGNKQSSRSSIRKLDKKNITSEDVNQISAISTYMSVCTDLKEFQELIAEHEKIIGKIIGKNPIAEEHFNDFDGSIKSLGAWGGDFIMAVTHKPEKYIYDYFSGKNLKTIFNYDQIVLNNSL